jgi:YfiH family protein
MLHLRSQQLDHPRIAHRFFGRAGGVSTGIFASLNCGPGSDDARDNVVENRNRALTQLTDTTDSRLLTLYQVHGAEAVVVERPWAIGQGPRADAMASNIFGLALGILTADCAPVLLADGEAGVIGAAHAGWQGALAGVTDSVINAMEQLGANRKRVAAAVGPCISQANYEVGPEFVARFRAADERNTRWFAPSGQPDHHRFNLAGYVSDRLSAAGIQSIETNPLCTYANETKFFSFRRATHRGEKDYGRQLSAILLRG